MTLQARATQAFKNAVQSYRFSMETNDIFYDGITLLNKISASGLAASEIEKKSDAIIIGTIICALIYNFHEDFGKDQKSYKERYGLKAMYPLQWQALLKASGLSEAEHKEKQKLITAVGHKALIERQLPVFSQDDVTKDGVIGQIFSDLAEGDVQNKKYRKYPSYHREQVVLAQYKAQEFKTKLLHAVGNFIGILAIVIPPLSLLFTVPATIKQRKQFAAAAISPPPYGKRC